MASSDEKRPKSGTLDYYPPPVKKGSVHVQASGNKTPEPNRRETGPLSSVPDYREDVKKTTPENGMSAYKGKETEEEVKGCKNSDTMAPYPQSSRNNSGSSSEIFQPGEIIEDKYKVLYVLGSGSMGVVYLTEDLSLKRKVAVKALAASFQREDVVVEKFHREAVAMAKVRHPNVVQIFSFGKHSGHSYFAMEYVRGTSLNELIEAYHGKGEPMVLSEAVGLLSQVCRGVNAIHKQGIVHRDLKPANILLDHEYRVSVVDFGLVRNLENVDGRSLELDGTPMYLAPERIRGTTLHKDQSHLCDIYSLGCIFYEMLTGFPPYESDSVLAVLDCHLVEDAPDALSVRPELPSSAQWVIKKAMAKDPAKRFQSCVEMETALNDSRTGSITVATTPRNTMEACKLLLFLIIDDDKNVRKKIVSILESEYPGAQIYEASDGDQGLGLALDLKPRLIVCHADTPNKNALEICSRLGADTTSTKPIILVTDKKVDPLRKRLYQDLGAEDLVLRHGSPETFAEVIRSLLPENKTDN